MNVEELEAADTLGRRLDRMSRRLIARRMPAMPWLQGLQPVLRRIVSAAGPGGRSYDRVEATLPPWTPPGEPLHAHLRARVERFTGPGLEPLRVHQGEAAGLIADAHASRAVAVGTDVFFEQGAFRPETPAGFGLLVHEATHVLEALRPGIAWRRATHAGVQREERLAQRAQADAAASYRIAIAGHLAADADLGPPRDAVRSSLDAPSAALRPMRAPATDPIASSPALPPPGLDVDKLRAQIHRDLLRQLRTDFERGA